MKALPRGRPIRDEQPKGRQIWRVPDDGYVIPRLRVRQANAIGFVVNQLPGDGEEDKQK